jgi:hypothetical protein
MAGFKNKKPRTGFNRPQATAGVVVDREWRNVYPEELKVGDIVANLGVVTDILPFPDCSGEIFVAAGLPESKDYWLAQDKTVKAFVRKAN